MYDVAASMWPAVAAAAEGICPEVEASLVAVCGGSSIFESGPDVAASPCLLSSCAIQVLARTNAVSLVPVVLNNSAGWST